MVLRGAASPSPPCRTVIRPLSHRRPADAAFDRDRPEERPRTPAQDRSDDPISHPVRARPARRAHLAQPHRPAPAHPPARRPARRRADRADGALLCPARHRGLHGERRRADRAARPGLCLDAGYLQRGADRRLAHRHRCRPCRGRRDLRSTLACRPSLAQRASAGWRGAGRAVRDPRRKGQGVHRDRAGRGHAGRTVRTPRAHDPGDRRAGRPLCARRPQCARGGVRRGRDPRRQRIPGQPVHLPPRQPAHRWLRRLAGQPAAPPARDRGGGRGGGRRRPDGRALHAAVREHRPGPRLYRAGRAGPARHLPSGRAGAGGGRRRLSVDRRSGLGQCARPAADVPGGGARGVQRTHPLCRPLHRRARRAADRQRASPTSSRSAAPSSPTPTCRRASRMAGRSTRCGPRRSTAAAPRG